MVQVFLILPKRGKTVYNTLYMWTTVLEIPPVCGLYVIQMYARYGCYNPIYMQYNCLVILYT